MNAAGASTAFGSAVTRIASVTSILRTRQADEDRAERHDGLPDDLAERLDSAAQRLEKVAARLERTIS